MMLWDGEPARPALQAFDAALDNLKRGEPLIPTEIIHPKKVGKHEVGHAFQVSQNAWGEFMKALAKGRPEDETELKGRTYIAAHIRARRLLEDL